MMHDSRCFFIVLFRELLDGQLGVLRAEFPTGAMGVKRAVTAQASCCVWQGGPGTPTPRRPRKPRPRRRKRRERGKPRSAPPPWKRGRPPTNLKGYMPTEHVSRSFVHDRAQPGSSAENKGLQHEPQAAPGRLQERGERGVRPGSVGLASHACSLTVRAKAQAKLEVWREKETSRKRKSQAKQMLGWVCVCKVR